MGSEELLRLVCVVGGRSMRDRLRSSESRAAWQFLTPNTTSSTRSSGYLAASALGSSRSKATTTTWITLYGHYYIGHNFIGHNYVGHKHVGHNYVGHKHVGHNCMGQNYIGHNYVGHDYISQDRKRQQQLGSPCTAPISYYALGAIHDDHYRPQF